MSPTGYPCPGPHSQTKWPPSPYLPSHLPLVDEPKPVTPVLTQPNKMAAISLLTLTLEPLVDEPKPFSPRATAKQNGRHLPTYPHT